MYSRKIVLQNQTNEAIEVFVSVSSGDEALFEERAEIEAGGEAVNEVEFPERGTYSVVIETGLRKEVEMKVDGKYGNLAVYIHEDYIDVSQVVES